LFVRKLSNFIDDKSTEMSYDEHLTNFAYKILNYWNLETHNIISFLRKTLSIETNYHPRET